MAPEVWDDSGCNSFDDNQETRFSLGKPENPDIQMGL